MKLSIVIPLMNQFSLVRAMEAQLYKTIPQDTQVIFLDNGSDIPYVPVNQNTKVIRYDKSVGVYPTFNMGFIYATGDVVAFFHSDLIVWEDGWIERVLYQFKQDPRLGMIGFIGSNEIDSSGGRGLGTVSNFMGKELTRYGDSYMTVRKMESGDHEAYLSWKGSPAEDHGKRNTLFTRAKVVDGCSMIIRREAWNDIGFREDFPPHHFYDRLISTQLLEKNWHIGVLGIQFDHISGQTVNQEPKYQRMAWEWLVDKGIVKDDFNPNWNYDQNIYLVAQEMWLTEYRDEKHLIPTKI